MFAEVSARLIVAGASSRSTVDPLAFGQRAAAGSPSHDDQARLAPNMFTAVVFSPFPSAVESFDYAKWLPADGKGEKTPDPVLLRTETDFDDLPVVAQRQQRG